jgi:hypothetical protein
MVGKPPIGLGDKLLVEVLKATGRLVATKTIVSA